MQYKNKNNKSNNTTYQKKNKVDTLLCSPFYRFCISIAEPGEINPSLILIRRERVLVKQGHYELGMKLRLSDLVTGGKLLNNSILNFQSTCDTLVNQSSTIGCSKISKNLESIVTQISDRNDYLKTFVKKRAKRSWHTLGIMNTDDLARIDNDLDRLRGNEEQIKNSINRQTEVIDSIYYFINNSMEQLNSKILSLHIKVKNVTHLTNEDKKFHNKIRETLNLENELMGLGLWIQLVSEELKQQQQIFTQLILNVEQSIDTTLVTKLVEPKLLLNILMSQTNTLPVDTTFPRRRDNQIYPEIVNLIEISSKVGSNLEIHVSLKIPLVNRKIYETFEAETEPGLLNDLVSFIKVDPNVLLLAEGTNWGHIISSTEFDNCQQLGDVAMCQLQAIEEDLADKNECLTMFYFKNSTATCEIRVLKATTNLWFKSREPNVWTYVAPNKTDIELLHGKNITRLSVYGTGKIRLNVNMQIRTKHVRIDYVNYNESEITELIIHAPNQTYLNLSNFNYKINDIPLIEEGKNIYSIIDHKSLFNLGIDVKDLQNYKTTLKNIIYDPMDHPWEFTGLLSGVALGMGGLICLILCNFKGSVVVNKTRVVPNTQTFDLSDTMFQGKIFTEKPATIIDCGTNMHTVKPSNYGVKPSYYGIKIQ